MVSHGQQQAYEGDTTSSPVVFGTIASIICAFLSVGLIAAYMPRNISLTLPIVFLIASVAFLGLAIVALSRRLNFAWERFRNVTKWVFILTGIFAGMAEFMFIYDRTPGSTLAILTVVLILSAVDIPVLLGFSVARHERLEE